MSEVIRVIIADDHPLIRKGIQIVLSATSDIQVVGEAQNGSEVMEKVAQIQADLLLLDVHMPGMETIEIVQRVQAQVPTLPILILSTHDDSAIVQSLVNAGVAGCLLKDESESTWVTMIRKSHQERASIQENLPKAQALSMAKANILTEREKAVLTAIAQGATNNEIARRFNLTDQTIRTYTSRIYEKLDIASRAEAIVWVLKHGLLPHPQESRPAPYSDDGLIGFIR